MFSLEVMNSFIDDELLYCPFCIVNIGIRKQNELLSIMRNGIFFKDIHELVKWVLRIIKSVEGEYITIVDEKRLLEYLRSKENIV